MTDVEKYQSWINQPTLTEKLESLVKTWKDEKHKAHHCAAIAEIDNEVEEMCKWLTAVNTINDCIKAIEKIIEEEK